MQIPDHNDMCFICGVDNAAQSDQLTLSLILMCLGPLVCCMGMDEAESHGLRLYSGEGLLIPWNLLQCCATSAASLDTWPGTAQTAMRPSNMSQCALDAAGWIATPPEPQTSSGPCLEP